jgi:hypothetical protein
VTTSATIQCLAPAIGYGEIFDKTEIRPNIVIPNAIAVPTEPTPEPLQNATYTYDGDGNLVKSVINGKSTYLLGKQY